jgi:vancomycin resistance protein YoaR
LTNEESEHTRRMERNQLKAYKPTEYAQKLIADQEMYKKNKAQAIDQLCKNVLDENIRLRHSKEQAKVIDKAFNRQLDFVSVMHDFNRFWANKQRYDNTVSEVELEKQKQDVEVNISDATLAAFRRQKLKQEQATHSYLEVQRFIKELQEYTDPKITKQELVQFMASGQVLPAMTLAEAGNPLNRIFKGYAGERADSRDRLPPDPLADSAQLVLAPDGGGKALLMEDQAYLTRDKKEE